jgi:site-specific recombinase XerD
MAMSGTDIQTLQKLLGHKDIKMTLRYSHLSDSHLKEAVCRLDYGTNMAQEVSLPASNA